MQNLKTLFVIPILIFELCTTNCNSAVEDIEAVANTVLINKSGSTSSGVYLGENIVLTNWHVCINSGNIDITHNDIIKKDDYLQVYNDPADESAAPYIEGAVNLNSMYCFDEKGLNYQVVEFDENKKTVNCRIVDGTKYMEIFFSRYSHALLPDKLLYANMDLDLCVIKVKNPSPPDKTLDNVFSPIFLDPAAIEKGDPVIYSGHPGGTEDIVTDYCNIISDSIQVLPDPDPLVHSTIAVPSHKTDCQKVQHGSSGSPVFSERSKRPNWTYLDNGKKWRSLRHCCKRLERLFRKAQQPKSLSVKPPFRYLFNKMNHLANSTV